VVLAGFFLGDDFQVGSAAVEAVVI
jgi:hypothetical protein